MTVAYRCRCHIKDIKNMLLCLLLIMSIWRIIKYTLLGLWMKTYNKNKHIVLYRCRERLPTTEGLVSAFYSHPVKWTGHKLLQSTYLPSHNFNLSLFLMSILHVNSFKMQGECTAHLTSLKLELILLSQM